MAEIKRGRKPKINDDVKLSIVELREQGFTTKEIQVKLDGKFGKLSPGISALQKFLARLPAPQEVAEIDKPWEIASLIVYPVAGHVVPILLELQKYWLNKPSESLESQKPDFSKIPEPANVQPLTIREALWANRLYAVTINSESLAEWARVYAQRERFSAIAGIPFHTTDYDQLLNEADPYRAVADRILNFR